jgi:hypothetical protein
MLWVMARGGCSLLHIVKSSGEAFLRCWAITRVTKGFACMVEVGQ